MILADPLPTDAPTSARTGGHRIKPSSRRLRAALGASSLPAACSPAGAPPRREPDRLAPARHVLRRQRRARRSASSACQRRSLSSDLGRRVAQRRPPRPPAPLRLRRRRELPAGQAVRPGETVTRSSAMVARQPRRARCLRTSTSPWPRRHVPAPTPSRRSRRARDHNDEAALPLRAADCIRPRVAVSTRSPRATAPGYIFAAPLLGPGPPGPMIFDNAGNLVWFHPLPSRRGSGRPAAQQSPRQERAHLVAGQDDSRSATGSARGTLHRRRQLPHRRPSSRPATASRPTSTSSPSLPKGAALVIGYSPVQQDLSLARRRVPAASRSTTPVQEVDMRTGLVMWEWHSLGHVTSPTATRNRRRSRRTAVRLLPPQLRRADGRRQPADLGAQHVGDLRDQRPHRRDRVAAGRQAEHVRARPRRPVRLPAQRRCLPDGTLSLFDDEGGAAGQRASRGVLVKLDTARPDGDAGQRVQFAHRRSLTASQGNIQQLPGGGWMVGWGGLPNFTEFDAPGPGHLRRPASRAASTATASTACPGADSRPTPPALAARPARARPHRCTRAGTARRRSLLAAARRGPARPS